MRRRRPASLLGSLCHATGVALVLLLVVPLLWLASGLMWLWLGLRLLCSLPALMHMAWDDWRFHRRRMPGCPYTLRQAAWLQIRAWLSEVGAL